MPAAASRRPGRRDRQSRPDDRLYSIFPEKFALSALYSPDPPARGSFKATFFRGHLERGGEAIPELTDVDVRVTGVVFARRFGQANKHDDLTYFLFGRGDERFLAHTISQPPDFDQILAVRVEGFSRRERLTPHRVLRYSANARPGAASARQFSPPHTLPPNGQEGVSRLQLLPNIELSFRLCCGPTDEHGDW